MERSFELDDFLMKTVRIDHDNVYLTFHVDGKRLNHVPEGYQLFYHLDNGSEQQQEPFEGTFVLYFARDYSLRKNGLTKVRFIQNRNHTVTVL